jgi:hypothetical protein
MTMIRLMPLVLVFLLAGCAGAAVAPDEAALGQSFPLGVYWPWERACGLAERNKVEKWAWVERCLDDMKAHHLNAIWVVNLGIPDLRPLADRCAARGIGLVPALGELHYSLEWRRNNWTYLEQESKRALAAAGDSPAILAWALCDEPGGAIVAEMETFRRKFHEWGAKQPTVVVTMWPDSPTYAEQAGFGAVCTDVYPFFSAGNPNGPNTPASSRAWYQRHVGITAQAALKSGQTPWIMPQCFVDVWGPWVYTPEGNVRALPGAIVHWRQPTPSEVRWQIWTALAAGTRGLFFYVMDPPPTDNANVKPYEGEAFPPELRLKEEVVIPGTGGIIKPDGASTPEYEVIAETYAAVEKLVPLLTGARPSTAALGALDGPGALGTLRNDDLNRTIGVVVNDDPDAAQALKIWLAKPREVRNLLTGETLKRAADNTVTITLGPGDGAVIEYVQ